MNTIKIKAPRLNANDDEILINDILIKLGDEIKKGDRVFVVETSKTSIELQAEYDGKVTKINVKKNDYIKVDSIIYELESTSSEKIATKESNKKSNKFPEKNISLKALKIIKDNQINIKDLEYIKEEIKLHHVLSYLKNNSVVTNENTKLPSIVFGCGLHAIEVANTLIEENIEFLGFSSKSSEDLGKIIFDKYKVVCSDNKLDEIESMNLKNVYIGLGGATSNQERKSLFDFIKKKKFNTPSVISNKAYVSKFSQIGEGTVVLPGATIGPEVVIGKNCIINNNSVVSHGSIIEDHVHLTPGSIIAGNCYIGELTTIGMASTVLFSTKIGKNCLTHNNSSVLINLEDNSEINNNGKIFSRK
tara:strand:- start:379 stop:1461 length:1083 start_codon:yes stop_codon:yes gene_type:complete